MATEGCFFTEQFCPSISVVLFKKTSAGFPWDKKDLFQRIDGLKSQLPFQKKSIIWVPVPQNLCLGSNKVERGIVRSLFCALLILLERDGGSFHSQHHNQVAIL